jgi:signal transduction histidine kinase
MNKKIVLEKLYTSLFCVVLIFICFFNSIVSGASTQTVRVGIYENNPKIFTDDKGNPSGFWPDIINYIATEEGWNIQYVNGSWSECLEKLKSNEIDMMPDVAYTEERAANYEFSRETVYTSWTQVYTRSGAKIQSVIDLEGKNVSVLKGSVNVEGPDGIKALARAFNITCTFNEADSYNAVFDLVKSGKSDAGVASKDFGYRNLYDYNLIETPIIFQPARIYFAFPKNAVLNRDLIERVDFQVEKLKKDSNSVYYKSLNKWLAPQSGTGSFIPVWMIWTLIGILALALLFGAGIFIFRAQVQSRTKELTEEIVKRKQVEIELQKHREDLEGLVKQRTFDLEQANLHKSQFLANMSHELRTPLNSIIGYTKLMLDGMEGSISTDQREDLQTVYDNSKHLLSLINDLLDLSKIEAGKFEIIKEEFAVSEIISKIIPGMEKLAGDKGLELNYSIEPGIDKIYADKNKTKQVLFNLIGNAIKFTRKGSVRLEISKNDHEFVFAVIDTGIGISQQDVAGLFQSYKQVGPARLDGYEGTGLGLVISKQFVELQGGKIWVESTLEKGSIFFFSLPFE